MNNKSEIKADNKNNYIINIDYNETISTNTTQNKVTKRSKYICWDDFFMLNAIISAQRSKDPSTQVGACIVNNDNIIMSIGYNGMPRGVSDDIFSWDREGGFLHTKYAFVCHSEANAILNCNESLKYCRLYVTLFPCNECAKLIIQKGISEIVYLSDKHAERDSTIASKQMLDSVGIQYRKHESKINSISIEF